MAWFVKRLGVLTMWWGNGTCMTSGAIIKALLIVLIASGCMVSPEAEFIPYRPSLGGNYYLQYEACGKPAPHPIKDALFCEEACCIWVTAGPVDTPSCEETWCCHAEEWEWFFHYEECY